ncbi:type II toxin-antitoxin system VapC family toxin [Jiella sp. MQZ9-1]|uniref:Ribonuclease VapC n=1 Tax=Jiella flava TaxID=2816857 RepID=A0A939FYD1_9HYPH|nr:type II toxin-antitoxin system VapC family toxin [Jiella flava]MBO0661802.1 type II toxin-antitoxin system VapC family toxin [Jiella flava]MCD2470443.1 type II toxin-antitoxin system VapC family toxin [Jiella flava]
MIVLDTNVISEIIKPQPDPVAAAWLSAQPRSNFYITAVTEAELRLGVEILPEGRRKAALRMAIERAIELAIGDRTLSFDREAARHYATIASACRRIGRPMTQSDCQIAAIALAHRAVLATRNVKDFQNCGVALINPWQP